jgi:hypothetical protein
VLVALHGLLGGPLALRLRRERVLVVAAERARRPEDVAPPEGGGRRRGRRRLDRESNVLQVGGLLVRDAADSAAEGAGLVDPGLEGVDRAVRGLGGLPLPVRAQARARGVDGVGDALHPPDQPVPRLTAVDEPVAGDAAGGTAVHLGVDLLVALPLPVGREHRPTSPRGS